MSANKNIALCLVLSTLLSPASSWADKSKELIELRDEAKASNVKYIEKKQPDSELTIAGIIIGKSRLSKVQKKFKGNPIFHEGDAGNSLYVLCYETSNGTILTFESNGEMGGPDHTITSAAIYDSKSSYRLKMKCAKSTSIGVLQFHDIYLGMTQSTAKKTRGKPSKETPEYLLYEYHSTEKVNGKQADIVSSVEMRFSNGKASEISVSKVESF